MELTAVPAAHSEQSRPVSRAVQLQLAPNGTVHMRTPDHSDTSSQDDLRRENAPDSSGLQG